MDTRAIYHLDIDGERFELGTGETTIGRSRTCFITLRDPSASRTHLTVTIDAAGARVRDMKSSNGTYFNGQPLVDERPLADGDRLTIGETELVFGVDQVQAAAEVADSPSATVRVQLALTPCKGCGVDLALGTEVCPRCRQDQREPVEVESSESSSSSAVAAAPSKNPTPASSSGPESPAPDSPVASSPISSSPIAGSPRTPASSLPPTLPAPPAAPSPPPAAAVPPPPAPVVVEPPKPAPAIPAAPPAPPAAPAAVRPPVDEVQLAPSPSAASAPLASVPVAPSHAARGSNPEFLPPAGFWIRLAAWVVDAVWINLVLIVVGFLLPGSIQAVVGGLLGLVLGLGVPIVGWGQFGTTPGKRLFHLYVCTVEGEVGLGYGRAALRLVGYVLSGLLIGIGFLMIGLTPAKRGLHDHLAGSYVCRR